MRKYYNLKKFEGLDLKKGDKVWLLHKNFKLRRLSKKLDYVKIGLFKIAKKILEVIYKFDLPAKIKIYLVQYIIMLELVYKDLVLLVYKEDTYKSQEEDKWLFKKIISYEEVDNKIWYKVLWEGYEETIWELEENLENAKDKIKAYQKRVGQVVRKKKD